MSKEERYAAVLERLSALENERLRQQEARRKDLAASASPLESGATFQAEFEEQKCTAERVLDEISKSDAGKAKAELDGLALRLAGMEKLVANASYYLPSYDIQASQACIDKLKAKMETAQREVAPRKKFSFRNKSVATAKSTTAPTPTACEEGDEDAGSTEVAKLESMVSDFLRQGSGHVIIRDKEKCTAVHDSESSSSEVMLSNLSSCEVYLRGRFRALFFYKLKDCKIYAGPVTGSVLLEEISRCRFMLASQQIRIHSTVDSEFYLRVRSRPIVEYVSNVRFAPYAFRYQGIEEDLKASNLDEETGMWDKVDDFRWLRASASPNWKLIPSSERLGIVDGSNARAG